ncbi:MAG: PKD domain-containing protein [Thermoplasmata archaeon]|nr:PKD domain-containing protein [Thermoplasmata archaeon]
MYDQNPFRTGDQGMERTLARTNASLLTISPHFPFAPSYLRAVAGSVAVANGTAYFPSAGGNLVALNVTTGTIHGSSSWVANTTHFGIINCSGSPSGLVSTPAIWGNLAIVGTGGALGAQGYGWVRAYNVTGPNPGTARWSTNLTGSVGGSWAGAYTWSSPVIAGGDAYIGLASGCDAPLVQGALFQLNATTGNILNVAHMVSTGQTGAGIWSSPTVDLKNHTVWVTTGNENKHQIYQQYARSLIALNTSTFQVIGHAQEGTPGTDQDFGAGPTLFSTSSGVPMVVAVNKNDSAYAFARSNFTGNMSPNGGVKGWVWEKYIGGPTTPGAIAPAAFGDSQLYFAGGPEGSQAGSVWALAPSGATIWHVGVGGYIRAGVTYADGLVIAAAIGSSNNASSVIILNATNGRLIAEYNASGQVNGEPAVADGRVYFGTAWGNAGGPDFSAPGSLYALEIPIHAQPNAYPGTVPTPVVVFDGLGIGGSPPYSCVWIFGPGARSNLCGLVSYSYTSTGVYEASLWVNDSVSESSRWIYTIQVVDNGGCLLGHPCSNWILVGNFTTGGCYAQPPSLFCPVNGLLDFASYSSGGTPPYTYLWNFGDRTQSELPTPIHQYLEPGEYTVTLTLTDKNHLQASTQFVVTAT